MEHFIKNIEIANFKSIRQATVKDCRRVNVFVGPPNVGKSNILEALSLFSITSTGKFKDLIRVTQDPTIFFNGNINQAFTITIDDEFKIIGEYSGNGISLERGVVKLHQPELFEYPYAVTEKPFYTNTILSFVGFEHRSSRSTAEHFIKWKPFPLPKKYEFKRYVEAELVDYRVLSYPFGENLFSVIQNNTSIRKDFAELLKEYDFELLFDSSNRKFSIFKKIEEGIFSVDYNLIADTLQRVIFYKTAIKSNTKQVLLLEEPESHMYPPYISKMTGDIIHDENNNQFFIATHSPYVLNDLIEDVEKEDLSIYIVGYDPKVGETLIHRMNEEEVHEAYQMGYHFFINIENFLPKNQHEQI